MHTLIHILVEADCQSAALNAAADALAVLVGDMEEPAVFDEFRMFSAAKGREDAVDIWGDLPPAAALDTAEGRHLLDQGWEDTKRKFEENLEHVRAALESFSDEEIMNDRTDIRHTFYRLGVLEGSPIHLYDKFGYGIGSRNRLEKTLDRYDDIWIVPADVVG